MTSFYVKTWGPGYGFVTTSEQAALDFVGRETERIFVKTDTRRRLPYADWKRAQEAEAPAVGAEA